MSTNERIGKSDIAKKKNEGELDLESPSRAQLTHGETKEKVSPSKKSAPNEERAQLCMLPSEHRTSSTPAKVKEEEKGKVMEKKNVDAGVEKVNPVKEISKIIESADTSVHMELTPPVCPILHRIPIIERSNSNPSNVAVPHLGSIMRAPPVNLDERPLVLATHLVPSLPVALFELFAEVIEVATGKAVVVLYEPRSSRPVAKNIVDIAILPAADDWEDGTLLPVSFVFEHRMKKDKNPSVYVDVVLARDCARNIEEILDLRGYRCSVPDRRKKLGAANLLFKYLKNKGENPNFFGNTLDSGSQLATLQMVAGKQTELGVLESPVINCHKNTLPGVESLFVLSSLGPLPPYRIMLNKNMQASLRDKIKECLLNVNRDESWMERLRTFGIMGFAEYSEDRYDLEDIKSVETSVPYY